MSYFNDIKKSHSHAKAMNQIASSEPTNEYPVIIQDGAVQSTAAFTMKETSREEAAKDFEFYVEGEFDIDFASMSRGIAEGSDKSITYVPVVSHKMDTTVSPACWIKGWEGEEIAEQAAQDAGIEYAG